MVDEFLSVNLWVCMHGVAFAGLPFDGSICRCNPIGHFGVYILFSILDNVKMRNRLTMHQFGLCYVSMHTEDMFQPAMAGYADGAPEMKNHLSMLGSIGAEDLSSPLGTLTELGSTRSAE